MWEVFSKWLKQAMGLQGETNKSLAKKTGMSPCTISYLRTGRKVPTDETKKKLEAVLGPMEKTPLQEPAQEQETKELYQQPSHVHETSDDELLKRKRSCAMDCRTCRLQCAVGHEINKRGIGHMIYTRRPYDSV